jgi:hypothetical protein
MLREVIQIHNVISSSGSGTVINCDYGSGSDFLTSYGSGSTSQKVTVSTVPVAQRCLAAAAQQAGGGGGYGGGCAAAAAAGQGGDGGGAGEGGGGRPPAGRVGERRRVSSQGNRHPSQHALAHILKICSSRQFFKPVVFITTQY